MKYLQKRKQGKLYKQWTKHAGLPPEVSSPPETPVDVKTEPVDVKIEAEEADWFYRFRVRILDIVRKILRVE
jgi:hypothetical protein